MSGILSGEDVKAAIAVGTIIVNPYTKACVKANSVDFHIGTKLYRQTPHVDSVINLHDHGGKMWNIKPEESKIREGMGRIPGWILSPGEIVLCHSMEIIGSTDLYTMMAKTKSTVHRLGIDLAASGGVGDVGYVGRWGLCLHNRSNKSVFIREKACLGQMVFHHVSNPVTKYKGGYSNSATEFDMSVILPKNLVCAPEAKTQNVPLPGANNVIKNVVKVPQIVAKEPVVVQGPGITETVVVEGPGSDKVVISLTVTTSK
jgi:dCTP deaminase